MASESQPKWLSGLSTRQGFWYIYSVPSMIVKSEVVLIAKAGGRKEQHKQKRTSISDECCLVRSKGGPFGHFGWKKYFKQAWGTGALSAGK